MTTLRSELYVEGPDDVHVVGHLLLRHGIQCFISQSQGNDVSPNAPEMTIHRLDGVRCAAIFKRLD